MYKTSKCRKLDKIKIDSQKDGNWLFAQCAISAPYETKIHLLNWSYDVLDHNHFCWYHCEYDTRYQFFEIGHLFIPLNGLVLDGATSFDATDYAQNYQ
jgi:hypothetical protein